MAFSTFSPAERWVCQTNHSNSVCGSEMAGVTSEMEKMVICSEREEILSPTRSG